MSEAYRRAGVDLAAAAEAVARIRDLAASATRPEVVEGVGGFAGLFRIGGGRLLAAATDGVGTKLEVARAAGRLDTVGIDLVAMCANDVVCTGAEPLFFLDYVATPRLIPADAAAIVEGIAEGCRRAGCALLGGETAEHPGTMEPGRFDLAGFCVGAVEESSVLGPHRVREGDVLLGLPSTGVHANGFSLIRRAMAEQGLDLAEVPEGLDRTLADELLEPTAIYVAAVLAAAPTGGLHAAAHITGGGIVENVPRALPAGLGADVDPRRWQEPPIFGLLRGWTGASEADLFRTFNMGMGMVLAVERARADDVAGAAAAEGFPASFIGEVGGAPGLRIRPR